MDYVSRVGVFLEVVRHNSFAKAARALGMTGPAVSKQVQSLEDQLGVRLLNRTTRQVTLTEEGAIYSERARNALEGLQEAEQQIQDLKMHPRGLLKINLPMSFGTKYLARPIAAFAVKYPQLRIEADFDDRQVDIIGEGYDVVVRIAALTDSSFIARKLADCPILLCASAEYIAKHGAPKKPEDLAKHNAIIFSKHGVQTEWKFVDKRGKTGSASLTKVFSADTAEMMLQACLHGVGIAILPIFVASTYLQSGQLVQLLPEYKTHPVRSIYAVFPQNKHLSNKVRLFVDWLTQSCKALPW
jgi:DNA-binding transcriptional LysR family regulator